MRLRCSWPCCRGGGRLKRASAPSRVTRTRAFVGSNVMSGRRSRRCGAPIRRGCEGHHEFNERGWIAAPRYGAGVRRITTDQRSRSSRWPVPVPTPGSVDALVAAEVGDPSRRRRSRSVLRSSAVLLAEPACRSAHRTWKASRTRLRQGAGSWIVRETAAAGVVISFDQMGPAARPTAVPAGRRRTPRRQRADYNRRPARATSSVPTTSTDRLRVRLRPRGVAATCSRS